MVDNHKNSLVDPVEMFIETLHCGCLSLEESVYLPLVTNGVYKDGNKHLQTPPCRPYTDHLKNSIEHQRIWIASNTSVPNAPSNRLISRPHCFVLVIATVIVLVLMIMSRL